MTISQPGSYKLSGNLTVPPGTSGIQITADGVWLDLNGFSITGPGTIPAGIAAINGDSRERIRVSNGAISGFQPGIQFSGTAELITLEGLHIDAELISNFGVVQGVAAIIGRTAAARAIIRDVTTKGQIQVTCPSVLVNVISSIGVVERTLPVDGSGFFSFPTNCKGQNVF